MTRSRRPSVLVAVADAVESATISAQSVQMGYPTMSVSTVNAALKAVQDSPPEIILADLSSAGVSAIDLCEEAREVAGDQCVIVAIADRDTGDLSRALAAGIDDVLAKPLVTGQLAARLLIAERLLELRRARRLADLEVSRMRWLANVGQAALTFQFEINNPLTALYGHLEMLRHSAGENGRDPLDIDNAFAQARRIELIVNQLAAGRSATHAHLQDQNTLNPPRAEAGC